MMEQILIGLVVALFIFALFVYLALDVDLRRDLAFNARAYCQRVRTATVRGHLHPRP